VTAWPSGAEEQWQGLEEWTHSKSLAGLLHIAARKTKALKVNGSAQGAATFAREKDLLMSVRIVEPMRTSLSSGNTMKIRMMRTTTSAQV